MNITDHCADCRKELRAASERFGCRTCFERRAADPTRCLGCIASHKASAHGENGQSGRSISEELTGLSVFRAAVDRHFGPERPLPNKTGRSGLPPVCRCGHENGEHCGRDGLGMCDVQVRPGELCDCDGFTP